MASFSLARRFDALTWLFSSIAYLSSQDELQRAVITFSQHLEPGGVLVVDGWVRPDRWLEPGTIHVETLEADDTTVVRVSRAERVGVVTFLEMHHLVATHGAIEHLVDHHRLTLFSERDYEAAFRVAGLALEVVAGPLPDRDRYVGLEVTGADGSAGGRWRREGSRRRTSEPASRASCKVAEFREYPRCTSLLRTGDILIGSSDPHRGRGVRQPVPHRHAGRGCLYRQSGHSRWASFGRV
jgi:SAM-dependent methyltransferase